MTFEDRVLEFIADLGADIKAALAGVIPAEVTLTANTDQVTEYTIEDDNTASSGWPNRVAWYFKPFGQSSNLVQWVNEYGELRLIPAKYNTIAFRIFAKQTSSDTTHSGPVFEICDTRIDRNLRFSVDGDGNVVSTGTITRAVPSGPTLSTGYLVLATGASIPTNTPANTLIVRY